MGRLDDWVAKMPNLFLAGIEVRPVIATDSPEFAQCIDLYEKAFPEGERETLEAIQGWLTVASQGGLAPDNYHILVAIDTAREHVCGVVFFHYLGSVGCGFIGYLVVDPDLQSQGLGSALLQAVPVMLRSDAQRMGHEPPCGLLTELDKESVDEPITYDRFRFWQRHRFLPLELDWRYPRLHDGEPPAAMYLAYAPIDLRTRWQSLTERRARELVIAIYRSVYSRDTSDPDLALVLKSIEGNRAIQGRAILDPRSTAPPNPGAALDG